MKCLYCDREIVTESFYSLLFERDMLCSHCRRELGLRQRHFMLDGVKCEYFYSYNSLFKQLLLQYKECYDEALKDVFLYGIKEKLMYTDYPKETMQMLLLYANTFFDDSMDFSIDEKMRMIKGFICNAETLLHMKKGSMMDVMFPLFNK